MVRCPLRWFIALAMLLLLTVSAGGAQELAPTKLGDGIYAVRGPNNAINTGFVVGDRGVFVFSCQLAEYEQRLAAIQRVAGGKPIRFLANGHYAWDDTGCNHMLAEQGATALLALERYFETLRTKVRAMKESGKSLEEIKQGIVTEFTEFASWGKGGRLDPPAAVRSAAEVLYREISAAK